MMSNSSRLHPKVLRWIYQQNWSSLRDIQEASIDPILSGNTDVLISASTASGKTEAYFLPAISDMLENPNDTGVSLLYISPLKALINDQYRRLESLCKTTDVKATAWHGDGNQSKKSNFMKNPSGILLITPESLEAMLINHATFSKKAFANVRSIVIDEFHSFIGSERGMQLLSLMTRLEHLTDRLTSPIPRVALSATLGDIESVPVLLRSNKSLPCKIITSSGNSSIQLQIRGYEDPHITTTSDTRPIAEYRICKDLLKFCRGKSNLIFANTRGRTESVAAQLSDFCESLGVPNEFFPHHGSLSKETRHHLESRLQNGSLPTTGICTMTLELGIDVGNVDMVGQYNSPSSVHSLRQRVGRSGRRSGISTLRMFVAEKQLHKNSEPADSLRFELVESLAITRLLVASKWFEPADKALIHYSTLLQQTLAIIAQQGSASAPMLHSLLCVKGPFSNVSQNDFLLLLKSMGANKLIEQLGNGDLALGVDGEKLVNHYTFYAVFNAPEEYRVVSRGKIIGSLPLDFPLVPGQNFVFAGKRWLVIGFDPIQNLITVERSKSGAAPLFGGEKAPVHQVIREEMRKIYKSGSHTIDFNGHSMTVLNDEAIQLFNQGMLNYNDLDLAIEIFVDNGIDIHLFTWSGDKISNTLCAMLTNEGFSASSYGGIITVTGSSVKSIKECLLRSKQPGAFDLIAYCKKIPSLNKEKYDQFVPFQLLSRSYCGKHFDVSGAINWIDTNIFSE